jgi:hypothetical protein
MAIITSEASVNFCETARRNILEVLGALRTRSPTQYSDKCAKNDSSSEALINVKNDFSAILKILCSEKFIEVLF